MLGVFEMKVWIGLVLFCACAYAQGAYPDFFAVDFKPASSPACNGSNWADHGQAFGLRPSGVRYGWRRADTRLPQAAEINARDRNTGSPNCTFETFMHMQYNDCCRGSGVPAHIEWSVEVPDGFYEVTAHAGEPLHANSVHAIAANGVTVINAITPRHAGEIIIGTAVTEVADGFLVISAENNGGSNTKLNFLSVRAVSPPEDGDDDDDSGNTFPSNIVVNFQPADATPCNAEDWIDDGSAYGARANGWTYGWVEVGTVTPIDARGNVKLSARSHSLCQFRSLVHMQYPDCCTGNGVPHNIEWLIDVPSGFYRVSTTSGDLDARNSVHSISVNDVVLVDRVQPKNRKTPVTATSVVEVVNGFLRISGENRGYNTKLNQVAIEKVQTDGIGGELPNTPTPAPTPFDGCRPSPSQFNGEKISELPCNQVRVPLPYHLNFDADMPNTLSGSGFTMYLPGSRRPRSYDAARVDVVSATQLRIRSKSGSMVGTGNNMFNSLGVGLPLPTRSIAVTTRLYFPYEVAHKNERTCVYFGISDTDYFWACLVSSNSPMGDLFEIRLEEANSASILAEVSLSQVLDTTITRWLTLTLELLPETNTVKVKYTNVAMDHVADFGAYEVPPDFFSKDAAATDIFLGTRSFAGITTSHGFRRVASLGAVSFLFDSFHVDAIEDDEEQQGDGEIDFTSWYLEGLSFPTALTVGPNGKLYVAEATGSVTEMELDHSTQTILNRRTAMPKGRRLLLGVEADTNLAADGGIILWLSHSDVRQNAGDANSGVITKATWGQDYLTTEDVIVGLPRAQANHAPNNIHFGANGKLYIAIGGNTGGGTPNTYTSAFGPRPEQYFSAAILEADVYAEGFNGDCTPEEDPTTMDATGISTEKPGTRTTPACDVRVFASGTRNPFDFELHPNGKTYVVDNGLGGKGTYPLLTQGWTEGDSCHGPHTSETTTEVHDPGVRDDLLYILKENAYYGHPNPARDECIYFGGNPAEQDIEDALSVPRSPVQKDRIYWMGTPEYPNGTEPHTTYTLPVMSFGRNRSPNGIIAYRGDAFCGKLQGDLIVTYFSARDQIRRLILSEDGEHVIRDETLPRSTVATGANEDLNDPLCIAQDLHGNMFVTEFRGGRVRVFNPYQEYACTTSRLAEAKEPSHMFGFGYESLKEKVYLFGGRSKEDGGALSRDVYVYDHSVRRWQRAEEQLPEEVEASAVGVVDHAMYVFGGLDKYGRAMKTVSKFDGTTASISEEPAMDKALGAATAVELNGKILLIGGVDGTGTPIGSVIEFDPQDGSFVELEARMDTERAYAVAAVIQGIVHVCGGVNQLGESLDSCEMYKDNEWLPMKSMSTPRSRAGAVVVADKLVVSGGMHSQAGQLNPTVEEYDPIYNSWRRLATLENGGHSGGAVVRLQRGIFHFAGRTGQPKGGNQIVYYGP